MNILGLFNSNVLKCECTNRTKKQLCFEATYCIFRTTVSLIPTGLTKVICLVNHKLKVCKHLRPRLNSSGTRVKGFCPFNI